MEEKPNLIAEQFDFDIITNHIQMIMNKRDCNDILFRLQVNDNLEQLKIIFFKNYVGKKQTKTIEFYIPKTWKDYFKNAYRYKKWMKWWIKKHPIETKKLIFNFDKITVFPNVEVPNKPEFIEHFTYLESYPGSAWRKFQMEIKNDY